MQLEIKIKKIIKLNNIKKINAYPSTAPALAAAAIPFKP